MCLGSCFSSLRLCWPGRAPMWPMSLSQLPSYSVPGITFRCDKVQEKKGKKNISLPFVSFLKGKITFLEAASTLCFKPHWPDCIPTSLLVQSLAKRTYHHGRHRPVNTHPTKALSGVSLPETQGFTQRKFNTPTKLGFCWKEERGKYVALTSNCVYRTPYPNFPL